MAPPLMLTDITGFVALGHGVLLELRPMALSIGSWYGYESFERINDTFGDPSSSKHMPWPVANGGTDSIILENGTRGDLVEYYAAR